MSRHTSQGKKRHINLKSMYRWHRYIGIVVAFFVVLLSVTGIMLNHTEELNLDTTPVQSEIILNRYGIREPKQIPSYKITVGDDKKEVYFSQWDAQVYCNSTAFASVSTGLLGVVWYRDMYLLLCAESLNLYTLEGELIESLGLAQGLPKGAMALGLNAQQEVVVRVGTVFYAADIDLLTWKKGENTSNATIILSLSSSLPDALHQNITRQYRGDGLRLEQVILDIHSGRFFGAIGVYFMDIVALLFIFLAGSGIWIWFVGLLKQRRHNKKYRKH